MTFPCNPRHFFEGEAGAVSVDWVVLTMALVSMVVALLLFITNSATMIGGSLEAVLAQLLPNK